MWSHAAAAAGCAIAATLFPFPSHFEYSRELRRRYHAFCVTRATRRRFPEGTVMVPHTSNWRSRRRKDFFATASGATTSSASKETNMLHILSRFALSFVREQGSSPLSWTRVSFSGGWALHRIMRKTMANENRAREKTSSVEGKLMF